MKKKIVVLEVLTDLTNEELEDKEVYWTVPTVKAQNKTFEVHQVAVMTIQPAK